MLADDDQLALIQHAPLTSPPRPASSRMNIRSFAEYQSLYETSLAHPDDYWSRVAEQLEWVQPWREVVSGELPHTRWFVDGLSNVSTNCIDRHARVRPNQTALIGITEEGEERRWTYRELQTVTSRFAGALEDLGVTKGDVVAIFLPNLLETVAAVHACFRIGAIYNLIFSGFSEQALLDRLHDTGAKVVVTADESVRRGRILPLKAKLDAIIGDVPSIEKVVVVRRTGHVVAMESGRDLFFDDLVRNSSHEATPVPIEANEPGFIIYTSGTTAKPKGLVHSGLGFLVGSVHNVYYALDLAPDDVYWCTADVGWLTFPIFELVGGLAFGATYILYDGALDFPSADRLYDIVSRYRVTKLFTAPTVLRSLARQGDELLAPYDLSRLQRLALVGEPLDAQTWQWVFDKMGHGQVEINNTYGQSETGSAWASSIVGATPAKPGSCGIALPGHGAIVVDDDGNPVKAGQVGTLVLTTPFPTLARTIWGDPERYERTYFSVPHHPDWYDTHDAAVIDSEGYIWVLGRIDDVINVAAHRLSTMELESAVLEVPAVAEAAVIGLPDDIKGEVPAAIVTTRTSVNSGVLTEQVRQQIEQKVGAIARPALVISVENLPKTRSGKIVRRLLKDLLVGASSVGDLSGVENVEILDTLREELRRPPADP